MMSIIYKLIVNTSVLLTSLFVGYLFRIFGNDTVAYYLLAVIPQYTLCPYYSHYNTEGYRIFGSHYLIIAVLHWIIVISISVWAGKKCSLSISLSIFIIIAIISVVIVHLALSIFGYAFAIDVV